MDAHALTINPLWQVHINDWLSWLRAAARPSTTIYMRGYHLRRLAAAHIGRSPWSLAVDDLAVWMARYEWTANTRKSYRSSLTSFFGWAHATGRSGHNPAALLPTIRTPAGKPRPAPETVFKRALERAEPRVRLMLRLARYEGLRRGEIACVRSDDVHGRPEEWTLRVVGKGGRLRDVPLLDDIAVDVQAVNGWCFPGKIDGHLSAPQVGRLISRALPGRWTAHPLRHAFASRAYAGSRDIRAVQELLGHASVAVTQVYTAVPDGAMRQAVIAAAA